MSVPGHVGRTVADSTPWWPTPVRPPRGAPNIVVVLLDDMGFADIGPFGSEIETPALDGLAARGLRFTNYHTTPLCSPSRASLLTGLNHHRAGYAFVANADPGFPGYTFEIADDVPTLPEILRGAGYATFAVGKWHLTKDATMNDGAPRSSWPTQKGFDRFYGFLEGLTSLHHPHRLVRDNSVVEVDAYPEGYYLTDDLTDQAISMIKSLRAHDARKPYFLYLAHSAVHGPLMAKPSDIAKYRGKYTKGWDALREERFARQVAAGLFPEGTALPPRNSEQFLDVTAWDALPEDERLLFARYQEVYAAMVDSVDQNLGRLLAVIEQYGELDDTIVVFTSDNGGSGEGGVRGTRSYFKQFVHNVDLPGDWGPDVPRDLELIGGPQTMVHYPRGWGMASNTPFRLYKGSTHAGGVRVPFLLSWPSRTATAGVRDRYQYVTDLLPTLLDLAGVVRPETVRGVPATALDGASFADALDDPAAPSTHPEQYAEMTGNRAFYRDGWKLVTLHRHGRPHEEDPWELYDLRTDPTETHDLASERPELVAELAQAWERAALENKVFPLDDGTGYLWTARPPAERSFHEPVTLLAGTPTLERYRASQLITFRDFRVDVRLTQGPGDQGVLVAHGDQGGGYALYVEDGHLHLAYNEYGELTTLAGQALPPGAHTVSLVAAALPGYRWDLALELDGAPAGRLGAVRMLLGLAPVEGIDVGIDRRSPVSWPLYERHGPFPYGGDLISVTYTPGAPAGYDPREVLAALRAAAESYD
ncbi:arylsulfatase [Sphaerisporangium krabiense]|uniref:Arylsulfatase n=1 Tax=Sphaerisporangium krabiense TaxID=763782 RepID=A0A7W9DQW8_9ACTN|nr:arylsulfatase [Sphaerisporangium krabiense]MBB5627951.1 arylsulfatase [Sphaerisporangium krabiense]GII62111.1 arylsulfatase [Sphaerisporangium krabiense]